VAGIATLSMTRWIMGVLLGFAALGGAGPQVWLRTGVGVAADLLMLALMVRVIGSWFGAGRYGLLRPAWLVTDWLVEPIRRRLPAMGPVDISPIVAWFVLVVLRGILLTVL
jgi:YggT family protein